MELNYEFVTTLAASWRLPDGANVHSVLASASGDGLVYELLNGLAARPDARKALRIPIAPIPTGMAVCYLC
jgi:diacylglycerol kinase family enzyme